MRKMNYYAGVLMLTLSTFAIQAQSVNPLKSTFTWTGKKVTGEHTGNIQLKSGTIQFDGKQLKGGNFIMTNVEALAKNQFKVTGNLVVKGSSHPNSFTVTVEEKGNQKTFKGTMVVDRTLYDVRYGSGKFFDNLGDKVIYDNFDIAFSLVVE